MLYTNLDYDWASQTWNSGSDDMYSTNLELALSSLSCNKMLFVLLLSDVPGLRDRLIE